MIKIGVIGYGYWGPNLARNIQENDAAELAWIVDASEARLQQANARYPSARKSTEAEDILSDASVDAVVIATPVASHFDFAMRALKADKHVLVEKPIAQTSEQAKLLLHEAAGRDLVLMVGHTFVYWGPVQKIHELIERRELGDVQYYDSVRINLGLFQRDVNVLWDLAVHDLSIMHYILPFHPVEVSATGISHVAGQPENTAYLTLFFNENCIAHIHVSWLSPVKQRMTLVGGSEKMVVYDDHLPSEAIKIYDKGITVNESKESLYNMLIQYRAGDMLAPQFDRTEALKKEVSHFLNCIDTKAKPLSDGLAGLQVVRILEAASLSMKEKGRPVALQSNGCVP